MNKKSSEKLSEELTNYNHYILNILKQIQDFDVWYESTNKKEFPKEWYSAIKSTDTEEQS